MTSIRLVQLTAERDALVRQILARPLQDSVPPPSANSAADISVSITATREDSVSLAQVEAALDSARRARAERIRLLSKYNEVKDVAQGLIGLVAEMRACRVVDVMRDLDVEDDD
ncbi:hypothetical protein K461DRAFT_274448 [Myriangium duriaei CBS 260.36]|uniref:Uncharacterized protein n=1 Tax=Myriangium duriaei CBS 260.36 TaxID=1168546 RepID=A0A9P4JAT9_9PEZI|nr:hypothetical protein K461DRAFT_274448 [Myriangium duriaei CBS 260.36]